VTGPWSEDASARIDPAPAEVQEGELTREMNLYVRGAKHRLSWIDTADPPAATTVLHACGCVICMAPNLGKPGGGCAWLHMSNPRRQAIRPVDHRCS
jgi:hypothetical protein